MKVLQLDKRIVIVLAVLVLLVLSAAGYYSYHYYQSQKNVSNTSQDEVGNIVKEVGKHVELPQDDVPTLATVTDIEKLKDQPFFQRAKNGDKVLLYNQSKKAYLYRPESKKVIDIAPINNAEQADDSSNEQDVAGAQATPAPSPVEVKVALRNGTDISGLTKKVEPTIKSILSTALVTSRGNANINTYDKTLIYAPANFSVDQVQQLATGLNASVVNSLPEGEELPQDADILILLGSDKN
jgi:hypothetical protein